MGNDHLHPSHLGHEPDIVIREGGIWLRCIRPDIWPTLVVDVRSVGGGGRCHFLIERGVAFDFRPARDRSPSRPELPQ